MDESNLRSAADQPITFASQDRLDRAWFAHQLADQLTHYRDPACLVIALYGPWGCGKSSLLNLIDERVRAVSENRGSRPIIVRFNPWNFQSSDQLISMFFREIGIAVGNQRGIAIASEIGLLLVTLGELLSHTTSVPHLQEVGWVGKVMTWLGRLLQRKQRVRTLEEIKRELDAHMSRLENRLIIMVDDLDRLESDNVRLMLRLLSLNGDMPNTTYMLAFDKDVLAKALDTVQVGIRGQGFLEKIVQVGLDIPPIAPEHLNSLFFERLDAIVRDVLDEEWDQSRWRSMYLSGIRRLLRTPRDVVRYTNSLRFTLPVVKAEVNAIDFVAVEAIRVFHPELYSFLSNNRDVLLRQPSVMPSQDKLQEKLAADTLSPLGLSGTEEGESFRAILLELFPNSSRLLGAGNVSYTGMESQWRAERRICSPTHFDIYFRLRLSPGGMSEVELQAILRATNDRSALTEKLAGTIGKPGFGRLIEYVRDHVGVLSPEQCKNLLDALFEVGDQVDTRAPMIGVSPRDHLVFLASQIFKQMKDQAEQDATLNLLAKEARSLSALVDFLALVAKSGNRQSYGATDGQPLFSSKAVEETIAIVLGRIRESAKQGQLLMLPDPLNVIFRWRDWAGTTEEVSRYIAETVETDEGLLRVLVAFVSEIQSSGGYYGDVLVTKFANREYLAMFLDLSSITPRVQALLENPPRDLSKAETMALQTFLHPPEKAQRFS